jgi:hypothetical protein
LTTKVGNLHHWPNYKSWQLASLARLQKLATCITGPTTKLTSLAKLQKLAPGITGNTKKVGNLHQSTGWTTQVGNLHHITGWTTKVGNVQQWLDYNLHHLLDFKSWQLASLA